MVLNQSGFLPLPSLLRGFRPVFVVSLVLLNLVLMPTLANASKKKFRVSKANQKELIAYLGISTQVFCFALEEKVDYEKAGRIAARPLFSVLNELHGRKVYGIKSQLSKEELARWVDNNVVLRAASVCPNLFPKEVLESVDQFKEQVKRDAKK